tara:strand:+ start:1546 stop:1722 length:177 start_codon:yes stop_codon:yes gene_type:complete
MVNRPRDSIKWNEILQVSVTTEMKDQIIELANEAGTSQSCVARELIALGLEKELSLGA